MEPQRGREVDGHPSKPTKGASYGISQFFFLLFQIVFLRQVEPCLRQQGRQVQQQPVAERARQRARQQQPLFGRPQLQQPLLQEQQQVTAAGRRPTGTGLRNPCLVGASPQAFFFP
jgi:hypothetical protein